MIGRGTEPFDAFLPRLDKSVPIASLHDAQVFARRWVIRDKDPALRALMRRLDRVHGGETAAGALDELRRELGARNLLIPPGQRPRR